jgi:hypothetical protein
VADRVKYAEVFADWLVDLGYTHCFFVAGGNIMHLLDGVRTRMTCVPTVHEVALGKKAVTVNGKQAEVDVFTKWMLFIPTTTQFRFFKPNDPKPYVVESTGFQVAISDKGKDDWTFIDGSGLTVSDLRSLFPTLPEDLELPAIGGREVGGAKER